MATIYYRNNESLKSLFDKISESPDSDIEIQSESDALVWQNIENKAIIEAFATRLDKKVRLLKLTSDSAPQENKAESPVISEQVAIPTTEKSKPKRTSKSWLAYPRVLLLLALLFVVIGAGAVSAGMYYLPRAEVQLTVAKQTISEQTTLTLRSEQESIDVETMSVPVSEEQITKELSKEFPTTGIETVGETATGSIVVYNWTDVSVQLPVGQVFTVNANQEGSGFEFIGKEQVTVPPREEVSEELGEKSTTAGSATVLVEASELGAAYNLQGNLFFTIVGYAYGDEGLQGINPSAFSGGTTEEIKVVSQTDIDTAKSELQETLEAAAREEMATKAGGTKAVVAESIKTAIISNEFDKAVGEEATALTGRMTIRLTAQVYDSAQVEQLLEQLLQDNIPDGFLLAEDEMIVTSAYSGQSPEGFTQLSVRVEALVLPNLDVNQIRESLAGVTTEQAQNTIAALDRVSAGNVVLHPRLLAFIQRLPFRSDRITITIQEE